MYAVSAEDDFLFEEDDFQKLIKEMLKVRISNGSKEKGK